MLRTRTYLRTFVTSATRHSAAPGAPGGNGGTGGNNGGFSRPGPPPLPRADQREFEELQRRFNAPASEPIQGASTANPPANEERLTMHPDMRKTPPPQFKGDTNPVTGEVGGPKREPLTHGDWSYGGRATDF